MLKKLMKNLEKWQKLGKINLETQKLIVKHPITVYRKLLKETVKVSLMVIFIIFSFNFKEE